MNFRNKLMGICLHFIFYLSKFECSSMNVPDENSDKFELNMMRVFARQSFVLRFPLNSILNV